MSDQDILLWVTAAIAAAAWVRFAEHPTARNLRAAIADTLDLWAARAGGETETISPPGAR